MDREMKAEGLAGSITRGSRRTSRDEKKEMMPFPRPFFLGNFSSQECILLRSSSSIHLDLITYSLSSERYILQN